MTEKEEALAQVVWLSKNIGTVADLMTHFGENITLIDLFNKLVSEKQEYWKKITE